MPWETAPQRMTRVIGEQNYNRGFASNNDPNRKVQVNGQMVNASPANSTTSAKSYRLTPQEIDAGKKRQTDAYTAWREKNRAKTNTPAQAAAAQRSTSRADATSALAGGGQRRGDTSSQKMR